MKKLIVFLMLLFSFAAESQACYVKNLMTPYSPIPPITVNGSMRFGDLTVTLLKSDGEYAEILIKTPDGETSKTVRSDSRFRMNACGLEVTFQVASIHVGGIYLQVMDSAKDTR